MNRELEPDDELLKLWQGAGAENGKDTERIMKLVEERAKSFQRTIFWRNVREYIAAAVAAPLFAVTGYWAKDPMMRTGNWIVAAAAVWIMIFMWLMQRSRTGPAPELPGGEYQRALFAMYDRQISLLKTAWLWYALPLTAGLVLSTFGSSHGNPVAGVVIACLMAGIGAGISVMNWNAAKRVSGEKAQLVRMLRGAE